MSRRNLTDSHLNLNSNSNSQENFHSTGTNSPEFGLSNEDSMGPNHNMENPFLASDEDEDYDMTTNNDNNNNTRDTNPYSTHSNDPQSGSSSLNYNQGINNDDNNDKGLLQDDSTRFNFEDSTAHNISDYKGYYSRNVSAINDTTNDNLLPQNFPNSNNRQTQHLNN